MVMVYPIQLISRGCSSHQFKLQKEHEGRYDIVRSESLVTNGQGHTGES